MTFAYHRHHMAQALAVIAEAGVDGLLYNYPIEMLNKELRPRRSRKARWSIIPAHAFSPDEFECYLKLAWWWGLIDRTRYKEVPWVSGLNKSSYSVEDEVIELTQKGWQFVEDFDQPIFKKWVINLQDNVPSIIASVLTALVTGWAIFYLGAPT